MRALLGFYFFSALLVAQTAPTADPTKPANLMLPTAELGAPTDESGLRVTAIMQKAETFFAIVNGKVMRVGDEGFGATVKSIDKDSVVLEIVTNGIMEERRLRVVSAENLKKNATENF
ncbi:hypothetical protein [Alteromonas flava]|uniref:hypothetical protein n=1 Tax=Alteromonas flava TaxID=2048003 RepID=UPI000C29223B|nr:hypothetical protein [Alteromonas flava]